MGLIAKILSFTRTVRNSANVSDVKIDPGGGPNTTADHFGPAGDDSFPLKTDYAVTVPIPGSGREAVVGYVDPVNVPVAAEGDKRIYARDPATGAVVVEIWLQNDGMAVMENAAASFTIALDGSITGLNGGGGYFELQAGGDFVVNGATITASGDFVDSAGKTLRTHTHPQGNDSDGDTQQNTGVPV